MGNQSSSCSKYQKKSKTPPKHQKIPPLSPNLNQKPLNYKQSQLILDRKAIPQNSIFDDFEKRYQEIKETINFISNVLEFRDTTEVNCNILMNNTMLTCKILKESNSNMISFDKILNKNSYKNTKIISYQNEVELETIKTLDFLDILNKNQKEPSPYPENYIEIVKNRASKEKNQKFQRNSLKLIKENSLNLNSNRFETDNDTETEQNLQNMKRSSKKKEISVPVPIKPEFEKDFPFDVNENDLKQTNNNNALANLTYSKITYVEADQTQSVFGRMSFGSEQFNQHLPEQKLNTSEDKIVNLELKIPGRFVESESESLKKENSLQNSKLKEQIIKILGHLEAGKDSKENIRNLMQDLSPNTPKTLIENKEKLNNISLIKEETQPYISRNNSKIDKISNRSQISIKTNKNSTSARSITPTPKKKQLVVQNHYLNKEANSYSSIMKHKKNENLQTYKKLLNCSNVDKNANYKNVIYQTSQKNIKNPNNFTNSNNKIKGSENKPNNKEKISNSKENINLQNLGKNNHCSNNGIPIKFNMKIQMTSSDISQNDDNLVYNVKNDFQNLKNQYSDKFTKIIDTFNERESKKEEIAQALSLKDRINQAIARRKTHENEENNIDIKQVIDLLPNYDPESNKNEMSDDNDEDSD